MLAALQRVYAACGSCSQDDYAALRASTEPSERTIRCRFGTFNKAKVAAGLPCTVKKRKKNYHGKGHKQGDYFCYACREQVHEMAANMAWLG
jgi:hypothetical protein